MPRRLHVLLLFLGIVGCGYVQTAAPPPSPFKLLVFTIDDCYACERDKPTVEEIRQYVPVVVMDGEKDRAVKRHYGVRMYPTYIFFEGDREIWRTNYAEHALARIELLFLP